MGECISWYLVEEEYEVNDCVEMVLDCLTKESRLLYRNQFIISSI